MSQLMTNCVGEYADEYEEVLVEHGIDAEALERGAEEEEYERLRKKFARMIT